MCVCGIVILNITSFITCSSVVDQFAHFALHDSERLPRLLLHQQPQLPQAGEGEQVVYAVALTKPSRDETWVSTRTTKTTFQHFLFVSAELSKRAGCLPTVMCTALTCTAAFTQGRSSTPTQYRMCDMK